MRIGIILAILLMATSPVFIFPGHAGCSGSCSISGSSSYDFLGDPFINPSMDTFDDFVRDKLGQTSLSAKSITLEGQSLNSSINQTNNGNISLKSTDAFNATNNRVTGISDSCNLKLGGSAEQDVRQSALASAIFDNNMI